MSKTPLDQSDLFPTLPTSTPAPVEAGATLTLTRRYFYWYTIDIAACGAVAGAALLWLALTTLKAAGVLS